MTGKDARHNGWRHSTWAKRLSLFVAAFALIAVCIAGRYLWGPGRATAQAPVRNRPAQTQATSQRVGTATQATVRGGAVASARQQPGVVAVVNGQQLTRDELAQECLRRYGKDVLESIVNKHLIWHACQKKGIAITEQDVESEIELMAKKFGLSTDHWLTMLHREREISPDQYRREIIWPTLALRRLSAEQIVVTREELQQAFESEYGAKVKVRMITVGAKEKADQLYQRASAEPDKFGDLAKEHSEDANSASARGLIPPIRKYVGHREIENAAFALKEGEITPVIHVANQYLILKCEKQIPETYISSEHIARIESQLGDQIRDRKLRLAATGMFKALQAESKVVNVYNDANLRQQMPGVAATINGQPISLQQLSDECLTRYGKEVIDGEINRLILQQELQRQGKAVTDASIDDEIARAADAYAYLKPDGSPDIDAWLKKVTETDNVTVDLYVRDAVWPSVALKQLVGDSIAVSKEDLEKGFVANYGERVEALAIIVGSQRQANTVWELARNNPSDQFFGELANQYSIEPVSRANFGKVPPIRRFSGQPVLEEEAFRLQAGELSGILAIGDKYIILKCQGRTDPLVQEFAAVESELRKDLREKKLRVAMAEEFDRLKESARIDNFIAGSSQPGARIKTAQPPASTQRR